MLALPGGAAYGASKMLALPGRAPRPVFQVHPRQKTATISKDMTSPVEPPIPRVAARALMVEARVGEALVLDPSGPLVGQVTEQSLPASPPEAPIIATKRGTATIISNGKTILVAGDVLSLVSVPNLAPLVETVLHGHPVEYPDPQPAAPS